MSWHFSQALVEAYLPATCSDGEPSAQSSGNPIPQAYLCSDRMTAFSRLSRFGMTFATLTDTLGEAVLTSFLAAFPARTSAQPEKEQASKVSDPECGWKWPASSVKYDPASCSWKTRQRSLLGGLVEFSETWPRWGSMRNGECWEQPMWERRTSETESGSWVTATATDSHPWTGGELYQTSTGSVRARNENGGSSNRGLAAQVMWPTPTVSSGAQVAWDKTPGQTGGTTLEGMVRWREGMWPTPVATMSKGSSPSSLTRKSGRDRSNDRLDHAVMAKDGGQLNPTWVEWLMGWPLGHTDLKPLETAKFPCAPLKRGAG